jgi:hypothetical protein
VQRTIGVTVAYGPLGLFIILTALTNFFPTILDGVSINMLLALSGLCLLGVGFFLQERFRDLEVKHSAVEMALTSLRTTQQSLIDVSRRSFSPTSLADGFRRKASAGLRTRVVRIYAISSQQLLSFFSAENFEADEVRILVRGIKVLGEENNEFGSQIRLVMQDWNRLARAGKIASLKIRCYDFLPTEYQIIFDHDSMISGLYDSNPADYSGVIVRDPVYVDGATSDGRAMLGNYVERFDNLFRKCESGHGPNLFDEICVPPLRASEAIVKP